MMGHRLLMAASNLGLTYVETVLQDKPVAFWQLNETSGTVAKDSSGNGNNGTYAQDFSLGQPPLASGLPVCVQITSTAGFIAGPSSPVNLPVGNSPYTLECWASSLEPESYYTSTGAPLLGFGGYGTDYAVNALKFMANSANNGNGFTNYWWAEDLGPTETCNQNTTYYIAATFDGTTRRLYVNGTLIASDNPTNHNVTTASNLTIGSPNSSQNTTQSLVGYVSNVAIYNTALSAARIQAHYNAGIS